MWRSIRIERVVFPTDSDNFTLAIGTDTNTREELRLSSHRTRSVSPSRRPSQVLVCPICVRCRYWTSLRTTERRSEGFVTFTSFSWTQGGSNP
jgi:hypothetical protein